MAIDTRVNDPYARNTVDGRIAGWSRWRVPQEDGNRDEIWPAIPEGLDMTCIGPFFGGMAENRAELMGKRSHWCKLSVSRRLILEMKRESGNSMGKDLRLT